MAERRPVVFVGSSSEALPVAEAIQQNLDFSCDVTIWSQGHFNLGEATLETLVAKAPEFDFAILLLTPDDVTVSRQEERNSPRDNVLLELGLFLGVLGRDRTFCVCDRQVKLKLPSDLAGVTVADYQRHSNDNWQSSVGAACTQIKNRISRVGLRKRPSDVLVINVDEQFQVIRDLLDYAEIGFFILMDEMNVSLRREDRFGQGVNYVFRKGSNRGGGGFAVENFCIRLADAGLLVPDLRGNVCLSDRGRQFARWLVEKGHKPDFFKTPLGGWGEDDGKFKLPRFQ